MTMRMLIAGGYGLIGSTIARQVRTLSPDVELVLAGRNPEKGAALAGELGRASIAYLDVGNEAGLPDLAAIDLIVSALYDPANSLALTALARGVAHIGITTKADEVAPIAFAALRSPPKRPIVLLGHSMAGVATIVAQKAAQPFRRVDSIAVAALYDIRDPVGPMTAGDAEMLISRALLREGGIWKWVEGPQHARPVRLTDSVLDGYPAGLLDAPSLASITGAANVRTRPASGRFYRDARRRPGLQRCVRRHRRRSAIGSAFQAPNHRVRSEGACASDRAWGPGRDRTRSRPGWPASRSRRPVSARNAHLARRRHGAPRAIRRSDCAREGDGRSASSRKCRRVVLGEIRERAGRFAGGLLHSRPHCRCLVAAIVRVVLQQTFRLPPGEAGVQ